MTDKQDKSCNSGTHRTLSRRLFIAKGLAAAAGSIFIAPGVSAEQLAGLYGKKELNLDSLKGKFKGQLLTPSDADFKKAVFGELWNKLSVKPNRAPQLVAQVTDDDDVIAVIKFAKENKLKVAVRGGGHNWCAPSIRNSGVMIDLSNLTKVISIDPEKRIAITQPIVSNREMIAALKPHSLAYPTGHCPPVKMSGYLLSGGMAWNQGVWGPGVGSIEAIEMVTADGELITASKDQNQDYFWAARGAGPGLFAVCLRYHLKLYPLPQHIAASVYFYPYDKIVEVAEWLGPLAKDLTNKVELSLFAVQAPPELAEQCKANNGKIALVTGTVFADSEEEAKTALAPLNDCPLIAQCLKKTVAEETDFEKLFDASGGLWPGDLRCKVDAMFFNASLADLFKVTKDHFVKVESPKTVLMFAIFTGKNVPAPLLDTAFSMSAKLYGGPWTMWDTESDDKKNGAWHEQCVNLLKPHVAGHYVSETDTVGHPDYVKKSYKEANFARLGELRKKYDPSGVFFSFSDGLS